MVEGGGARGELAESQAAGGHGSFSVCWSEERFIAGCWFIESVDGIEFSD